MRADRVGRSELPGPISRISPVAAAVGTAHSTAAALSPIAAAVSRAPSTAVGIGPGAVAVPVRSRRHG
ncbi:MULTISPECIES: hypothetical protein [unclassified Streptomyces]|uniref:hypothetical protein n=1 Tax=unclassified Streptomyces TaxID=2593676 RepID=UPI00210C5919|nr:hypothetical protein [Streptomyces sp. ScaeMP-e83]